MLYVSLLCCSLVSCLCLSILCVFSWVGVQVWIEGSRQIRVRVRVRVHVAQTIAACHTLVVLPSVPLRLNAFFKMLFKCNFFSFPLAGNSAKLKLGLEVYGIPTAIVTATAYKEDGLLLNGAVDMLWASISLLISTSLTF